MLAAASAVGILQLYIISFTSLLGIDVSRTLANAKLSISVGLSMYKFHRNQKLFEKWKKPPIA